jgi:multiple sugar transport system permease protein
LGDLKVYPSKLRGHPKSLKERLIFVMQAKATHLANSKGRDRNRKNKHTQNIPALLFLAPWIIGLLIFTAGPMLSSLYYSFTQYSLLSNPVWVGLKNYKTMFLGDPLFFTSVKVTFLYVLLATPLKLITALAVALLLNKGMKALGFYRSVYYIPSLLGGSVAIAMLWRQMFGSFGLVNQVLQLIGIENTTNWIGNPRYALYTLVILFAWQFGSPMIIFLAGIKQIPVQYYEAAHVDGAGKILQFFHVTFPCLSPILFFNLIMQLITAFQSFTPAFIISNGSGGPLNSTMLYSLYLYQKAFSFMQMGYASAMAWVLLLMIGFFILCIFGSSKYWVHYGDGGI